MSLQSVLKQSTFYWPMRCMEPAKREALFALYRFCRAVDDIADSTTLSADEKTQQLDRYRTAIDEQDASLLSSELVTTIKLYELPTCYFRDILDGMQMDVDGTMHQPSDETFERYCYCVASAVGLLAIRIFGCSQPESEQVAQHLGQAMQRVNILRDIGDDAAHGRLYVPESLLKKYHLQSLDTPQIAKQPDLLLPALTKLAEQAEQHFEHAYLHMQPEDFRALFPARAMAALYQALLAKMQQGQWQSASRYRLPLAQIGWVMGKLWLMPTR